MKAISNVGTLINSQLTTTYDELCMSDILFYFLFALLVINQIVWTEKKTFY